MRATSSVDCLAGDSSRIARSRAQFHSYATDNRTGRMHLIASSPAICSAPTEHGPTTRSHYHNLSSSAKIHIYPGHNSQMRVTRRRTLLRQGAMRPRSPKDCGSPHLRGVGFEAQWPHLALPHTSAAAASASSTACIAQSQHRAFAPFAGTAEPVDTRAIGAGREGQS